MGKEKIFEKLENDIVFQGKLNQYCKHILNESRHIVTEFNNVISWLSKNIKNFKHYTLIYTGWDWNLIDKACFKNSNNSGYPIYISIDSDFDDYSFAYIENRDLSNDKIIIHINANNVDDIDIKSKLSHEFTYIRTMFSQIQKNPLETKKIKYTIKDICYYLDIKNRKYSLNSFSNAQEKTLFNQHFLNAINCLYYMSETEQEARINQIYKYIVDKYDVTNVPNRNILLKEIDDISLLSDFIEAYESIENSNNQYAFRKVLCLAFYLNDLGCIHYDILSDKQLMLDFLTY